jgi:hypothetical protein
MISCRSSSSRAALAAVLATAALAVLGAGCRTGRGRPDGEAPRYAVFPPDNVSAGQAPTAKLRLAIDYALARVGIEVVTGDAVDAFLARHRIRYTGGVDRATAALAREELGVEGVLVTSLELYVDAQPPKIALAMRLVSADPEATLRWMDVVGLTGVDAPGLLDLGVVGDVQKLERTALARLARSLERYLAGKGRAFPLCGVEDRFQPRAAFRSPRFDREKPYSIAVVPFVNETERRGAGEAMALEFARQLAATGRFRVLEPGVVRDHLLKYRVVMEDGVSLDAARVLLGSLEADVVMAGRAIEFDDAVASGAPRVAFSTVMLERSSRDVIWQSTSHARGDDGVVGFQVGTIRTATALSCLMARQVVDEMLHSEEVERWAEIGM